MHFLRATYPASLSPDIMAHFKGLLHDNQKKLEICFANCFLTQKVYAIFLSNTVL
jgi:hypothetical protein